ncbi:hypothetical protein [Streptomyces sp. NPDC045369]|uniref:hypothetical protein n=1 Tax=Streptomyces sp. NPDC045369 TaxID=3155732 RepID=UPI0033FF748A
MNGLTYRFLISDLAPSLKQVVPAQPDVCKGVNGPIRTSIVTFDVSTSRDGLPVFILCDHDNSTNRSPV